MKFTEEYPNKLVIEIQTDDIGKDKQLAYGMFNLLKALVQKEK
jgi:hypothetical protein